tara:strand:- start:4929 stop:5069 length:141 start_codon:yes stop_codon:yes gene_type:complete
MSKGAAIWPTPFSFLHMPVCFPHFGKACSSNVAWKFAAFGVMNGHN